MIQDRNSIKQCVLNYAQQHERVDYTRLVEELGLNINTAKQYLSALTKEKKLDRTARGEYHLTKRQTFEFIPDKALEKLHRRLKKAFPYTDFCIYDGSIFSSLQHHLAFNRAIYVETNREAVSAVFSHLKETQERVYKQPDAKWMYDYVNLKEPCLIVKTFVTESPVNSVNGVPVPTLEKLLVDIQKDADFDYMQGYESVYMYQMAFDLYAVNVSKLLRYAKRRNAYNEVYALVEQSNKP